MATMIVDAAGVQPAADLADIESRVAARTFFWLDIVGEDQAARSQRLDQLGLAGADVAWCLRFGQAGRMHLGPQRLRAATWIADRNGELIEIHVIGCTRGVATVWTGDATILDPVRRQFAERVGSLEGNLHHATAILLQLLLGPLDAAVLRLDSLIDELRLGLDKGGPSADFASQTRHLQKVQTFSASFSRYSSAVRSAMVGVEAVQGVGERGADELNDYVEQVEDVEEQLYERRRWMSDITHEFATAIAQRQSEQISRLTLVSIIFLPVTALTGFFGMNFEWMSTMLASREAFFLLGVLLPVLSVALSMGWLARLGLLRDGLVNPSDPGGGSRRPQP